MNPNDLPVAAPPQTPLQQALKGADPQAVLADHGRRLQLVRQRLLLRLEQGLAPADYAQGRLLLAMCEAALRVLHTLAAQTPCIPTGPAAALPGLTLTP